MSDATPPSAAVPAVPAAHRPAVPRLRREVRAFGEIFALYGLAIAQPVLDLFGRAPQQFVFRGAGGSDVLLFAIGVVLVPPLLLWVVEALVGLVERRARSAIHVALLAVLCWAFVVQLARPLTTGATLMALAVALAAGAALLYLRFTAAKVWLGFVAVAPLLFAVLFLVASPTGRLLGGDRVAALDQGIGSPAPVVMIVFDELPTASIVDSDGEVDADLLPHLADLADDSHWFRNATTLTSFTWHAVPSLLTGQMPRHATAPFASDHPENLFTLLAGAYELNVIESLTRLCPSNLCEPVRTGRRDLIGDVVRVMQARLSYSGEQGDPVAGLVEPAADIPDDDALPDEEVPHTERFAALLDGIVDDSLALHYLHLLLPHQPFRFLPSGRTYPGPDPDIGRDHDTWEDQDWPPALGRQRHLLQLRFTDSLLGQLLAHLRDRGLYDDALVVVTADHGIAFRAGRPIRLIDDQPFDDEVAPELLWVPLFVKLPGQQEAVISDDNVLLADVLPTIADVLDMELPSPVDGRSVFGPPRQETTKPFRPGFVYEFGIGLTEEVEVDGVAGLQAVLDLAVDRFLPPAGEPDRLWRIGPSSSLVGTSAGDLPLVASDLADPVRDLDPDGGSVPALVRARVDGVVPGDGVAVAVNGVIGATAAVFEEGGRPAVAVIVSDELFRAGPNEITIHHLGG